MPIDATPPAPRAKRTPAAKPNTGSARAEIAAAREAGLNGIGQIAAAGCIAGGYWADAATIKIHWPNVARETAKLADQYDMVAKVVDMLVGVGPLTGILAAALPMALQFAANHKVIDAGKAGLVGVEDPDDLSARIQVEVETARAIARLQAQQERAELEKMLAEAERLANGDQPG